MSANSSCTQAPLIRRHTGEYQWDGVETHPYKEDGTHFKSIVRRTLFRGQGSMPIEFRYFEVGAGGHSTLERHQHEHLVLIARGVGEVLLADEVHGIGLFDLIHIPSNTWHQFRANKGEPLGFLCIVNNDRDRPERPTPEQIAEFFGAQDLASFIRP